MLAPPPFSDFATQMHYFPLPMDHHISILSLLLLLLLLLMAFSVLATADDPFVGVNVNMNIPNRPSPVELETLLVDHKIRHVRLHDADPSVLVGLANTGVELTITLENYLIPLISTSPSFAEAWVSANLSNHLPQTKIVAICVGNEVLGDGSPYNSLLLKAFDRLHSALISSPLTAHIKLSTPISFSTLRTWYPPSLSYFNLSLVSTLRPILGFLASTSSPLMLNAYPYYEYLSSSTPIPLDFTLFRQPSPLPASDPTAHLNYTNLFDVMLDAAYSALANLSFTNISIMVSETGWPWSAPDATKDPQATLANAFLYSNNLIHKVMRRRGTPLHPNTSIHVFLRELYDDGGGHQGRPLRFGVFHPDGRMIYPLNLNGSGMPKTDSGSSPRFCVASPGQGDVALQGALDWACGAGRANCSALQPTGPCSLPDTKISHASFAFNDYYQKHRNDQDSCDFGGMARLVFNDPSYGLCVYTGSNGQKLRVNETVASDKPPTSSSFPSCFAYPLHLVFLFCILLFA